MEPTITASIIPHIEFTPAFEQSLNMTAASDPAKWVDLINASVHSNEDIDVGDVIAVNRDFCRENRLCEYTLLLYSYYES